MATCKMRYSEILKLHAISSSTVEPPHEEMPLAEEDAACLLSLPCPRSRGSRGERTGHVASSPPTASAALWSPWVPDAHCHRDVCTRASVGVS